jgi:hypothetical protein
MNKCIERSGLSDFGALGVPSKMLKLFETAGTRARRAKSNATPAKTIMDTNNIQSWITGRCPASVAKGEVELIEEVDESEDSTG